MYDAGKDPYLDQTTGILKNSLGIISQKELDDAEADISTVVLATLIDNPIAGGFDLKHLQDIHRALFSDLYTWAGEVRTVELAKDNTRFANPEFLHQSADKLFAELKLEKYLKDLKNGAYIERLAHYFSEVNILHPFREGNGRTQRAFFTLIAAESGKTISWQDMSPEENLKSSIAAYNGDVSVLVYMLSGLLS